MMEILVDAVRLERTEAGSLVGPIHFRLDGEPFPDAQWWDFPVVVVQWWIGEVSRFAAEPSPSTRELLLMDGPYRVRLTRKPDANDASYEAIKDTRAGEQAVLRGQCDPQRLLRSLCQAAEELLSSCSRQQVRTSQVEKLEAALAEARN